LNRLLRTLHIPNAKELGIFSLAAGILHRTTPVKVRILLLLCLGPIGGLRRFFSPSVDRKRPRQRLHLVSA